MQKALRPLLRPDGAGSHSMLGNLVDGAHAGPTLLVSLPRGHVSAVADALGRIPRLGDMRGRLAMVQYRCHWRGCRPRRLAAQTYRTCR